MAFEKPLGSRDRASHMPENQGGRRGKGRSEGGRKGSRAGGREGRGRKEQGVTRHGTTGAAA